MRQRLAARGLAPSKARGQNFLRRPETAERIVRACEIAPGDAVIEIGPGLGALTPRLAAGARRLLAIEVDRGLVEALREQGLPENVELLHADALRTDLAAEVARLGPPAVLVGNLPYVIGGRLLGELLLEPSAFRRWVFMLQSEVGDRLLARPGSSDYGPLAVFAALSVHVSRVLELGPDEFEPRPKVRSTLLAFEPRPAPEPIADREALRALVRQVFQQRRKMLQRVLRNLLPDPIPVLRGLDIDPQCRGETLEPAAFVRLCAALREHPDVRLTRNPAQP